ncbi:MAG: flagellar motor switch protein FliN [Proteobacteria bacterium]|nr:flagellar motor switch protein FliN [Pseudomonadota bacterium]
MEDNQGFSPEDFGLDSKALGASSQQDQSNLSKFGEESSMNRVDISRMKMVLDVPLKVTVELGRTKLLVNDLLQLGQGSVIELDKMAGEPMEIYVNDKLVAMGEVVVVNEKFGVRLTDVMSGLGIEDVPPPDAV